MNSVYESIASTNTAQGLTAGNVTHATYGKASSALVSVETKSIRYTLGGTSPTTGGVGAPVAAGQQIELNTFDGIDAFEFVSSVADQAATLHVIYEYV